jgi:hypothetical protein
MANSFSSEASTAADVDYRRRLAPFLEWTVSSIYEGDNRVQNRGGLATQLWAVHSFLDDRLVLGMGGGPISCDDEQLEFTRRGLWCIRAPSGRLEIPEGSKASLPVP